MKKYLVKLNRPVMIEDCLGEESKLQPVYGFLAPVYDDFDEELYCIDLYVDYLAAMHEWCAKQEKEFDITEDKDWVDKEGVVHYENDRWFMEICHQSRKKIGLDFTWYLIDLESVEGNCLGCGMEGGFITCESLMDNLTRLAEQQAAKKKEQYSVMVFNRPIWLPKHILWEGEDGFCHIYGIISDRQIDRSLWEDGYSYLGYLAMCEELALGVMPGGYTADLEKDGTRWYKDGREFNCRSDEILAEGQRCRRKNNLILHTAILRVPPDYLNKRVRNEFILSQDLYESLIEVIASADSE